MSQALEIAAGTGTVALNILTWSGMIQSFEAFQKIVTCIVTIAMIVYYVYGIIEKHKSINGKPRKRKE
jgi:hypothetical protein